MKRAVYALGAVLAVAVVGCRPSERPAQQPAPSRPVTAAPAPAGAEMAFPDVYDRVAPAVVSILAATTPRRSALSDSPFARRGPPPESEMSAGSGFFISADGLIVTNNHVIADADRVAVVLRDGKQLPARLVGRDPATDLAVLKVEGRGYPFVNFAAAAPPRVGEEVIAIGNPFGLGTTATTGIVSALGRDIGSAYVNFLQLDAAINQGNSGGPTFNRRGEVVGVNTAIFSPTGGSVGIGFAIPAATAAEVTRQLIASGRVERGFIGASLADVPSEPDGQPVVVVAGVVAGGPAARAGLRPGDQIAAVNGQAVSGAADVIRQVTGAPQGKALAFSIVRGGRTGAVSITPQRQ
ncbi:trypsin-like peptidase domain-containing protein [Caulobacter sp. 17J65-9]|uniref:S1C family serine protease n=1 Tax=Caulobacter sp. 17J65-9 TaxID=2709382 RepID=UPI0013C6ABC9|nr:trypsin-like peptidase domain-containing protein [Caulobacter sp. 17J65-9]NEX92224.1 trypsin-like serine protease [Caulobacter sp. 17J65-9]